MRPWLPGDYWHYTQTVIPFYLFRKEKSSSVEKLVAAVQAKKAASPKVLYLEDEKEEAARNRKLGNVST